MNKNELLWKLKASVNDFERQALMTMDTRLVIGKYNRQSMQKLLKMQDAGNQEIDEQKVTLLRHYLQVYLDQYMEEKEGHKWVILVSVYHAYILEIPIHPIEVTKIQMIQKENYTEYYCPCKEPGKESICNFCVCKPLISNT